MPDDDVLLRDAPTPPPTLAIGAALAALPLEAPDRSAWPRLAERIAAAARSGWIGHSPRRMVTRGIDG